MSDEKQWGEDTAGFVFLLGIAIAASIVTIGVAFALAVRFYHWIN